MRTRRPPTPLRDTPRIDSAQRKGMMATVCPSPAGLIAVHQLYCTIVMDHPLYTPVPPFGRPNHMSIYNDEQIQLVLKAAEDVLNQLGYEFGPGSKMRLAMPKLPMCN